MPLCLPSVSRRQFLAGTLAAGAGWFTLDQRRTAWSDEDARNHRWALFSDTHIAADPATRQGATNMFEHFQHATRQLLATQPLPSGMILSGDCAHRDGQSGDYERLAELLAPISKAGIPSHLLLGNHDHRQRFRDELVKAMPDPTPLPERQVAVVLSDRANWFLLDSLRNTAETAGELGAQQIAWLVAALDAHADRPAIIVGHHHPVIAGVPGLTDTDALFDVLAPRKQVKAYIFGHTHHWKVYKRGDIHLVNLPPVAYPFQERAPSGWVRVELLPDGAQLELVSLDDKHPAHGQKVDLKWRKA